MLCGCIYDCRMPRPSQYGRHELTAYSSRAFEASAMWKPVLRNFNFFHQWYTQIEILTYTTRQCSRVSCLAQTGFAAFGKGVQHFSGLPYVETEQLSRLTSLSGTLATSWCQVTIVWTKPTPLNSYCHVVRISKMKRCQSQRRTI